MHSHDADALIVEHMRLARRLAFRFGRTLPRFVDGDALESDAMLGLIQAARTFDPNRGVAFTTYATVRIRGAMLDGLRQREHCRRSVMPPEFVSLSTPVGRDDDGRAMMLGDLLPAPAQRSVGHALELRDEAEHVMRDWKPQLSRTLRDMHLRGLNQREVAGKHRVSQSCISLRLRSIRGLVAAARTKAEGDDE